MPIVYDENIIYDTPDYTYDGYFIGDPITFKEALYREFKIILGGIIEPDHIRLDERSENPDSDEQYPWVIFRRITDSEDNQTRYVRDRWEVEVICQTGNTQLGSDLAESVRITILEAFAGRGRRIGEYDEDGDLLPESGVRAKCWFVNSVPFREDKEIGELLGFVFSYFRG